MEEEEGREGPDEGGRFDSSRRFAPPHGFGIREGEKREREWVRDTHSLRASTKESVRASAIGSIGTCPLNSGNVAHRSSGQEYKTDTERQRQEKEHSVNMSVMDETDRVATGRPPLLLLLLDFLVPLNERNKNLFFVPEIKFLLLLYFPVSSLPSNDVTVDERCCTTYSNSIFPDLSLFTFTSHKTRKQLPLYLLYTGEKEIWFDLEATAVYIMERKFCRRIQWFPLYSM